MPSELAIFDITDGSITSVLQVNQLIEAPNWSNDGSALIVNGSGLLFRIMLSGTAKLEPIETAPAKRLNNDHGISPDGTLLAVSDETETGESAIYILPFAGGTPRRVTPLTPSYWHGWSPDGKKLAYCARRDGKFDIYACALDGSNETKLTDSVGHSDGPDYTSDGNWIWYNSSEGGTMQLWRMRQDGSDKQQMTHDERVNWFPHPSPDGKWVLYLAYENDVQGHPRDKNVELRLMPAEGGKPKTLLELFGGQGSINVPCWEPTSRRFAFVRYR